VKKSVSKMQCRPTSTQLTLESMSPDTRTPSYSSVGASARGRITVPETGDSLSELAAKSSLYADDDERAFLLVFFLSRDRRLRDESADRLVEWASSDVSPDRPVYLIFNKFRKRCVSCNL